MNPVKIIFFDIDGTLVDHATGQISDKTRLALTQLHQKGVLICIATGRPTASLPDFGDLHVDAFCAFNGSLCYAGDTIIHSTPISREDVAVVMKNAANLGRPISIAVRDRMAANGIEKDLADYYQLAGLQLEVSADFDMVFQQDIYQIMLGCRPCDHEDIIRGATGVKIAVSWDRAVDVIPATSGKGVSIAKILEYFHLDASQAMAFGDNDNDIEMLQSVGIGVAMGNASPRLKAVADTVCGHVSDDGIYHYCVEHGLI